MKRTLSLFFCAALVVSLFVLGGCSKRTAPKDTASSSSASSSALQQDEPSDFVPSSSEEASSSSGTEKYEIPDKATYHILKTGFEITLRHPWYGFEIDLPEGFVLYSGSPTATGNINIITGKDEISQLEQDIENMGDALKQDKTTTDVKVTQGKIGNYYNIYITYTNLNESGAVASYSYLKYQRTENSLIVAMVQTDSKDYDEEIQVMLASIRPSTDTAQDAHKLTMDEARTYISR